MDREELLTSILTADPQPGDLVYLERRGSSYGWRPASDGGPPSVPDPADSWIYYSLQRTLSDRDAAGALLDDLLAEMESMTGCGADRCRWPLDEPWPRPH